MQNVQCKIKGFTLVELLVAIAILMILSAVGFMIYGTTRADSRDARRLSDLKTIKQSLELYRSEKGYYPKSVSTEDLQLALEPYLESLPHDPFGGSYSYLTPEEECDSVNRCSRFVLCATKDGDKTYDVPSECPTNGIGVASD